MREIIRATREGRGRDGKTLGPPMPFDLYRRLSDNDVKAMVAYLRTVPAVRQAVPRSQYKIPLPDSYGPPVAGVPDPPRQDLVKYGEYLASPVAHCVECHTPFLPEGRPDRPGWAPAGSRSRARRGLRREPDAGLDTGLGNWKDGEIIASLSQRPSRRWSSRCRRCRPPLCPGARGRGHSGHPRVPPRAPADPEQGFRARASKKP